MSKGVFLRQMSYHPLPSRSLTQWSVGAAEAGCFVATYPRWANCYPPAGGPTLSA